MLHICMATAIVVYDYGPLSHRNPAKCNVIFCLKTVFLSYKILPQIIVVQFYSTAMQQSYQVKTHCLKSPLKELFNRHFYIIYNRH